MVNLVAAVVALIALTVAARPPDEHHNHACKAEYLSTVVEGAMIFVAALFIIYTAIERLLHPQPLGECQSCLGDLLVYL
ncbi:MAG: cation transporter [Nocardioidaceae bacterium]